MTPWHDRAGELLADWNLYKNARPRGDAVNLQIERDQLASWAYQLSWNVTWGADATEIAEACHQFDHRLRSYKDKIVMEILHHGTI